MSKAVRVPGLTRAGRIGVMLVALWKLFKHPQTPPAAKLVAILTLAYALSPIDLIPDFIPVLGQLDDLVVIPLGVALAVRLTPRAQWEACLREAESTSERLPRFWWAALGVLAVWALLLALFVAWLMRAMAAA